jgi:hypothetical protein
MSRWAEVRQSRRECKTSLAKDRGSFLQWWYNTSLHDHELPELPSCIWSYSIIWRSNFFGGGSDHNSRKEKTCWTAESFNCRTRITSQAPTSGTILSLYSLQNTQPLISQDYLLPLVVDGTMHHPYLHANFTWSIVAELWSQTSHVLQLHNQWPTILTHYVPSII